ncbi:hypothetical protein, partial [uncultured Faecalibaculum sp.]|uniref:hypothetical protein n=1 Tax=uncultured Faecalibaculum sp. TaxID=1729681 RepID=UPI00272E754D
FDFVEYIGSGVHCCQIIDRVHGVEIAGHLVTVIAAPVVFFKEILTGAGSRGFVVGFLGFACFDADFQLDEIIGGNAADFSLLPGL